MNIASLVRQQNRRRAKGLTLIELVLVVAILAILAGFIVPRLGFIRNLAGDAGNATILQQTTDAVVLFNTALGHYPQGEDTLLNAAGTPYVNLDPKLSGILNPLTLDANSAKSIVSQLDPAGLTVNVYNNDDTFTGPAGNSGTLPTQLTTAPLGGKVAQVKIPVAADVTGNKLNYQIYVAAYGLAKLDSTTGAPLDGTFLVAFGYGLNTETNGKSTLDSPSLFAKDTTKYNRPIVLLRVFGTGTTGAVPVGTSAATSITIAADGTTVAGYQTKYVVDQNR